MKKIVHYRVDTVIRKPAVGYSAMINTFNHPDLSNRQIEDGNIAITSTVVAVHEDGSFETQNTIYKPLQQLNG